MIQLKGASGAFLMDVNKEGQGLSRAISISAIHEATLLGNAYSWTAVSADVDALDVALLVANITTTQDLVITRIIVRSDVATQAKIHCPPTVVWAGGTAVIGNNLNRQFANNAPAVAFADEQTSVFAAANVIETLYIPLATNGEATTSLPQTYETDDALILGYGHAVAVELVEDTAEFETTIVGFFIDK